MELEIRVTTPPGSRELEGVDNITDTALKRFRIKYGDRSITKDTIFDNVYGVLHSPHYRDRFANDLAKGLPTLPFASDFRSSTTPTGGSTIPATW